MRTKQVRKEGIKHFTNAKSYGVLSIVCQLPYSPRAESYAMISNMSFDRHRKISLNLEMWSCKFHLILHKFGTTITLMWLLYISLYYDCININANTVSVDIIS